MRGPAGTPNFGPDGKLEKPEHEEAEGGGAAYKSPGRRAAEEQMAAAVAAREAKIQASIKRFWAQR